MIFDAQRLSFLSFKSNIKVLKMIVFAIIIIFKSSWGYFVFN